MGAKESKKRPDVLPQLQMFDAQGNRLLEAEERLRRQLYVSKRQEEASITAQRKLKKVANTAAELRKNQNDVIIAAQRKLEEEAASITAQRKLHAEAFITAHRKFQEEAATLAAQRKLQEEAVKAAAQIKFQKEALIVAQRKYQEEVAYFKAQINLQVEAAIAVQSKRQEEASNRKLQEEAANRKFQEEAARAAMQRKLQEELDEAARRKNQEEAAIRELQEEAAKKALREEVANRKLQEDTAKAAVQRKFQEETLIAAPIKQHKKPFLTATTLQEEAARGKQQEEAARRELQKAATKRALQDEATNRKLQDDAAKAAVQSKLQEEALIAAPRKQHKKPFLTATTLQEEVARRKHQEEAAKRELQKAATMRALQEDAAKAAVQSTLQEEALIAAPRKPNKKPFLTTTTLQEEAVKRKQQEEAGNRAFQEAVAMRARELPREADVLRYCSTCYTRSTMKMFACENGHDSCNDCKIKGRACGICRKNLTNRRSYDIKNHAAQMKVSCPNGRQGCVLHIKIAEIENHVQECPFKQHDCPLAAVFGNCKWFGEIYELSDHFADMHPKYLLTEVGSELRLQNFHRDYRYIRLVELRYHFVFHLKISKQDRKVYMAVQLIGTKISARKWLYEIHVYNKSEDHRKYVYTDNCRSSIDDMDDVFSSGECAVLPMKYANTFFNNELTYKFFIKKTNETRRGFHRNQRGRDFSEEMEEVDNGWSGLCTYIAYRREDNTPTTPGGGKLEM